MLGPPVSAGALAASLAMQTSSSGGSRLTEVKLLAVSPTGSPAASKQVTTVTPVAKQPSASRRVRGSDPVRYSDGGGGHAPLYRAHGFTQSPEMRRLRKSLGGR